MVVCHLAIKYGILYGFFNLAHLAAWLQAECCHYLFTSNWRLEIAYAVFLLQFHQLTPHEVVIFLETAHFFSIFRCDVGSTQCHKVIDIITGIKQQSSYCRVSDNLLDQCYRAHVQPHKFGHIFHFFVHRQTHALEYTRHHLFAYEIMVMERPAEFFIITFCGRFGNIVQKRSPPQPHIVAACSHVVKHLHRVQEIIFMPTPVHRFHAFQRGQFRENNFEQAASVEQHETSRRCARLHNLHQFIGNAFM